MHAIQLPKDFEFKKNSLSHMDRCFILGNGPTICKFDLSKLCGEFVLGANKILYSGFIPSILTISDLTIMNGNYSRHVIDTDIHLCVAQHVYKDWACKYEINLDRVVRSPKLMYKPIFRRDYLKLWHGDFEQVDCLGSVIGDLMIPLAIYLGFKEIYILGLDEYWNLLNAKDRHFYNHGLGNNFIAWAKDVNLRNIWFGKQDLLARLNGVQIVNLSPGSAIKAFEQKDACNIFPQIVNNKIINIIGKYIKINNKIHKIVKSNNGDIDACSIFNIEDGAFIRHYKGKIIYNKIEELKNIPLFNQDSSFYAEIGFTNKNKVSFRSCNIKNTYICKDHIFDEFHIKRFNTNFIASDSSFEVFEC